MNATPDRYFQAQLQLQTTLEATALVLSECAEALGWHLAAFHTNKDATSLPRARNGEFIARRMGWPALCLEGWSRRGFGQHCPVARRCGTATAPFLWSCDPQRTDTAWEGLTAEQHEVMDYYGRFMNGCVTVPVRLNAGSVGYVSWCSRDHVDLERRFHETFSSVYMLSHTFIRHVESLAVAEQPPPENTLTARERECLTWAARGKSEEEIGMIIQRSRETVHFHVRNAVTKLDAGNRTHAVAIACTRGLITPFDTPQPAAPFNSRTSRRERLSALRSIGVARSTSTRPR
jgi:DNA-binding CsgD family transcriptional regulator